MRHFILIFSLISMLISCGKNAKTVINHSSENDEFILIRLSIYGGDLGYYKSLTISRDSVIHSYFTAANNETVINRYKNEKENWRNLTESFKLSDFRKIKNGNSYQPADGTDQQIYIETKGRKDSIINGDADKENYDSIKKLVELLDKIGMQKR